MPRCRSSWFSMRRAFRAPRSLKLERKTPLTVSLQLNHLYFTCLYAVGSLFSSKCPCRLFERCGISVGKIRHSCQIVLKNAKSTYLAWCVFDATFNFVSGQCYFLKSDFNRSFRITERVFCSGALNQKIIVKKFNIQI